MNSPDPSSKSVWKPVQCFHPQTPSGPQELLGAWANRAHGSSHLWSQSIMSFGRARRAFFPPLFLVFFSQCHVALIGLCPSLWPDSITLYVSLLHFLNLLVAHACSGCFLCPAVGSNAATHSSKVTSFSFAGRGGTLVPSVLLVAPQPCGSGGSPRVHPPFCSNTLSIT